MCFVSVYTIMFSPFCLVRLMNDISLGSLWRLSSATSVSRQLCSVCLSVTLAVFHTSALRWKLEMFCSEMKAGNVHRSSWMNNFYCFSCLGKWWTSPVGKLELFFKEIGQQHALDTPGIFLVIATQLIPSWTGDFLCIWWDKTLSMKITVLGSIGLILAWWWDSEVSLGMLQDVPPETTNQQESKVLHLPERGDIF